MIDRNKNNFKSRFLSIRRNSLSRNGKNIKLDNNVSRFITYHIRIQPLRNLLSLIEIGRGEFPDFFDSCNSISRKKGLSSRKRFREAAIKERIRLKFA